MLCLPNGIFSGCPRRGFFVCFGTRTYQSGFAGIRLQRYSCETKLTMGNIERILRGCEASKSKIVRCGVSLANAADFSAMNEAYAAFFEGTAPASTTVQATLVEPEMKIEIDCVAYFPEKK